MYQPIGEDLINLHQRWFEELAVGESEPLALEWPGSSTQASGYARDSLLTRAIVSRAL
jgi:hypothetical protein